MKRLLTVYCALLMAGEGFAQEITPRAYWPAPRDTKLLVAAYGYQAGDVITDSTLIIEGAESKSHSAIFAYQQTLSLFGRTANLQLELPIASVSARAQLAGVPADRDLSGIGDASALLSVNLLGAPSMSVADFQLFRAKPRPILAVGVKLVAPTGQYDDNRLINIGSNRWATRVRLGYIQPLTNFWVLELSLGTWFFRDNKEFFGGVREQESITAFDASLIRRIRPGFWVSLDGTHYSGGRTKVNGNSRPNYQRNSRLGFAVSHPIARRHLWKLSVTSDISSESGGDFDTVSLSYAYRLN
jgi:hypothetical protein